MDLFALIKAAAGQTWSRPIMEVCAVSREISHNKGIRCASTPCRLPHRYQNNPNQPFMIDLFSYPGFDYPHPHPPPQSPPKNQHPRGQKKKNPLQRPPDRLCPAAGARSCALAFCVMSGLRRRSGSAPFQLLPLLFLFIWWSKCGFQQVNRPELEQQQAGWGCLARPQAEVEKPPVTASSQQPEQKRRSEKEIHPCLNRFHHCQLHHTHINLPET